MRKLVTICTTVFNGCLQDPKRVVKYVVLCVCTVVVVYQLSECFSKLFHPPVATHSYFNLNETVSYPALTFCRNRPYRPAQMAYYNLSTHPRYTSNWRRFRFGEHDLEAVFENVTYTADDMFIIYGLDQSADNIDIESRLYFNYGRCHTLIPRTTTRGSWKTHGYSIHLVHDSTDDYDDLPAGWHMFVHEPGENFTEINMETSGRSEYMFVRVNEDIEIKLGAQHFNAIPSREEPCELAPGYGFNTCAEECSWRRVTATANCSGPWMRGEVTQSWPYCSSYESMLQLIQGYMKLTDYNHTDCACPEPCRTIIYSANIMSRNALPSATLPGSRLFLYYSSKMVTIYQERPGYDLNQFVADIGGSLGFLLGLSVLGLIVMLEQIVVWLLKRCTRKPEAEADATDVEKENGSMSSTTTLAAVDRNADEGR